MIRVVRIIKRMREHDGWLDAAKLLDEFSGQLIRWAQRIVARVEESYLRAEHFSGLLGFVAANAFHFVESHSGLPPESFGLATFAVRETQDSDSAAARRIERDGSAGSPDEVGGVRAHDEHCVFVRIHPRHSIRRVRGMPMGFPGHRPSKL